MLFRSVVSFCTLRRAFNREARDFYDYGEDSEDDVDLLAIDDDLYVTKEDEYGRERKPVKAFRYGVDDDDDDDDRRRRRRTTDRRHDPSTDRVPRANSS